MTRYERLLERHHESFDLWCKLRDRGQDVDADNEQDWFSLCYGFALGRGIRLNDAYDFALACMQRGVM